MRKKNRPNSPVATHSMIRWAPDLLRSARTRIGSSGRELRLSISTNETRGTTAAAEIEALGLDLLEIQKLTPDRKPPQRGDGRSP